MAFTILVTGIIITRAINPEIFNDMPSFFIFLVVAAYAVVNDVWLSRGEK